MLAFLRRVFVGSWLGRLLAILIFLSFAAWGTGGFFADLLNGGAVGAGNIASVGGQPIDANQFSRTYRQGLASAAQTEHLSDPSALPYGERRMVAGAAIQQLVSQAAIGRAADRIGLVVPDAVIRQMILDEKAFAGPDGKFSRASYDQILQRAGLTQDQLVALLRGQAQAEGVLEPVRVGGRAPGELARRAFNYAAEQRVLDIQTVPLPAQPPALPDDAALQRFFNNNRARFAAPEYRRIKLVLLSPATVSRSIDVSDAEEHHAYDELITRYQVPEKRSVQLLIVPDAVRATTLATAWRAGTGWSQLQQQAGSAATPVALDDTSQAAIPSPDLARLVFAAPMGAVTGPTRTDAGWVVLVVSKITPAQNRSFDQVKSELHDMIGAQRAQALMAARVQKLQDAIAGGGLDAIPADLGAEAAEGTLDAQGLTPAGEPAPLPGSDAVRKAEIARAFVVGKGQAPTLAEGPEASWFAVQVEEVTPAAPLSFAQSADKVRAAWQADAARHDAEQQAAALMHQAQDAHGLAAVATGHPGFSPGLVIRRDQPSGAVPANMAQLAFTLKQGETTMLENPDGGFLVATLVGIRHPEPGSDKLAMDRMRAGLDLSVANDLQETFIRAQRDRLKTAIDDKAIDAVVGPSDAGGASSGGPS